MKINFKKGSASASRRRDGFTRTPKFGVTPKGGGFTHTPKFGVTPKGGGFTLIELLVVVAIIGILASVVLTSLGDARSKGADAAIKTNLNTVRGLSEIFYASNGNSFLPAGGVTLPIQTCPPYNAGATNMLVRDINIASAITEAVKQGQNGSVCYNAVGSWAVAVGLKTSATTSWCIDSSGASRKVNVAPAAAISGTACIP